MDPHPAKPSVRHQWHRTAGPEKVDQFRFTYCRSLAPQQESWESWLHHSSFPGAEFTTIGELWSITFGQSWNSPSARQSPVSFDVSCRDTKDARGGKRQREFQVRGDW